MAEDARSSDPAFPEDAAGVHLAARGPANAGLVAKWVALEAEGTPSGQEVAQTRFSLGADGKGTTALSPRPTQIFRVGRYRVDLTVNGQPGPSVAFTIVPILPEAAAFEASDRVWGRNIAAAALGGKVEGVTGPSGAPAEHLIDGGSEVTSRLQALRPWATQGPTFPQELVFSFHQGRRAAVAGVVIDTASDSRYTGYLDAIPRHVEVWVSTVSASEGFTKAAEARLPLRAGHHLIAFPPTPASYVKVRVLSNHGGGRTEIVEVKVLEDPGSETILADRAPNLALPALGGTVVRIQDMTGTPVGNLFDGRAGDHGWYTQLRLPREIVLAFRDQQEALIDRIVLNPSTDLGKSTWVKLVSVQVSRESPFDGWEEVGRFTLEQAARDQAFPVRRRARFLKLRILENYGDRQTSLGELQVIEGRAEGYRSILLERPAPLLARAMRPAVPVPGGEELTGREPDDTPGEAMPLPLGRRVRGTITPTGDVDHYAITVPPPGPALLTVELAGHPSIRTSVELLDAHGQVVRRFGPRDAGARTTAFTWLVNPGDYMVRVAEPKLSIVLAFDTSGSMGGAIQDLEQAIRAYVEAVQPTERVGLVRFGAGSPDEIVILTQTLTNDRATLRTALEGQFKAVGGTPLYDAVARAFDLLKNAEGNRAVVVMTDGEDSGSKITLPEFWDLLERGRIPTYAVLLGNRLQQYHPGLGTSIRGLFGHLSAATQARAYFTPDSAALRGLYEQIASELRTPVSYDLRVTVSPGLGTLRVETGGEPVGAPAQVELILDASGSMRRRLGNRMMIDVAREVLAEVIAALPEQAHVGLRVYGHRVREGRQGDCEDSELVVPIGPLDRAAMLSAVRRMNALGTTPIAYSLRQVARDFGSRPGEKLVILVTDGKEECGGSPQAVVGELLRAGLKVRLNIVGFALADAATRQEMTRVAALTGGAFFDARDAAALRSAIDRSLAIPFDVFEATGKRVGGGLTGGSVSVPEGVYTVVLRPAGEPVTIRGVRIRYGGATRVVLTKDGREIGFRVIPPDGTPR